MSRLRPVRVARHLVGSLAAAPLVLALFAAPAVAHAGSLGGSLAAAPVPFWLVAATGGGVVGVSFLFTSFLTDADLLRAAADRGPTVGLPSAWTTARTAARAAGVGTLALVIGFGALGVSSPRRNLAVLVVWVGWWAGYAASTYLVGNSWPALDPWRTLAAFLPRSTRRYPARLGGWPSVVGLLALVFVEVVSPLAEDPRALAAVVAAYTLLTLGGAATYGDAWFDRVDPVSRVFRFYGRMAPVQRTDGGLTLSLPGAALVSDPASSPDDTAFVVALLWATTYDGLVSTPAWNGVVRALSTPVPPVVVHLAAVALGFAAFLGAYRLAARAARGTAGTYVTARYVAGWFAPALLPIAAGYHLAHFSSYFLNLAPALAVVALDPLSPPAPPVLLVPDWFGGVQLALVVVGHALAVWVAHARSFALFPGRIRPIRSQYPFVVVMVAYTMSSMWILAQPYAGVVT